MVIDKGSPLFEAMGGMHNVYINSTGETALEKGQLYPDKTLLLVDLHQFTISDGSYVEGPRKATAIMLKDKKKYASTGGWGFQAWAGGDPKKPLVTDAIKQCFECHQARKGLLDLHPLTAERKSPHLIGCSQQAPILSIETAFRSPCQSI
jgi:Cytochrome P460